MLEKVVRSITAVWSTGKRPKGSHILRKGPAALLSGGAVWLLLFLLPVPVYAQNAAAYTYTISVDGKWIRTQDAYLPGAILLKELGLKKPEDIFVRDGKLYIADSGNHRVVVADTEGKILSVIGEKELDTPTGVFVNPEGELVVADYGQGKAALFSPGGELVRWYGRPESPIFGENTSFKPRKAVMDRRGNLYLVSEGSYDGIVQLSREGDFLGYFGANKTGKSFVESLQDLVFSREQKEKLFHRLPPTFGNLSIDEKGMVYTVTQSMPGNAVKKHNVSGRQILYEAEWMVDEDNFTDITVGRYGQIYAVSETGLVYEYDSTGSLVFSFGGRAISTERSGLFTVASGIAADEHDCLYILDRERGIVQVFYPTAFAEKTHQAIRLFEDGKYGESKELWQEILKWSGVSRIAHNGIGKGYFQEADYEQAALHFKIAGNRADYSECYWELRNAWLESNLLWVLAGGVFLLLAVKLLRFAVRRMGVPKPVECVLVKFRENRLASDILYLGHVLRHPVDSFYEIRRDRRGTVFSATVIYLAALAVFGGDFLFRSFIFKLRDARTTSYLYVALIFLLPCALWVVGNYMVSSINEGEGRLKDVYLFTAYSLAPLIVFMPFVTLATYLLTNNERFIVDLATLVIWVWCGVTMFIGVKEIHDYDIRDVIKNILLTLFFMFIVVIAASLV